MQIGSTQLLYVNAQSCTSSKYYKVEPIEGLCIQCLPCSEKELVSSRLDGGCPPAAPRSNSVLGLIRHDMQEY
jgi:hypothetical protein